MTLKRNDTKAGYVRGMFARIASDYNFMNRLMTMGMDQSCRRFLISRAMLPSGGKILDVGTGTGDIALEARRAYPDARITGVDFTAEMMDVGRSRIGAEGIGWCLADALRLPFPEGTFDAVVSGFLVRNVVDVSSAIREQTRVAKPGGMVVCLDTSPVKRSLLRPFIMFYLKAVIPFLGRTLTGEGNAYGYLISSTLNFIEAEALADIMRDAGLKDVSFKRMMLGNVAVHWGMRPK